MIVLKNFLGLSIFNPFGLKQPVELNTFQTAHKLENV